MPERLVHEPERLVYERAVVRNGVMAFEGSVAAYEVECRTEMVPMRDGTKLATDIYLPSRAGVLVDPGPVPCILVRPSPSPRRPAPPRRHPSVS